MKVIDAHAHLNFPQFDADRAAVIARCEEAEIGVINVGTDLNTSRQAVKLTEENDNMWATVGLHPTDIEQGWDETTFLDLAKSSKVVAIGECGLDYFHVTDAQERVRQKDFFAQQIAVANRVGKPLMLHIRGAGAYHDAYEVIKAQAKVAGNVHFFAGTWEEARWFLDLGLTLSFTGVITFTHDYDEVIKNMPLDRLIAETDCPYVAPVPYRGKRNEPSYVLEVVKRLGELRGLTTEAISQITLDNTRRSLLC
jgi:TatD DNase family protein